MNLFVDFLQLLLQLIQLVKHSRAAFVYDAQFIDQAGHARDASRLEIFPQVVANLAVLASVVRLVLPNIQTKIILGARLLVMAVFPYDLMSSIYTVQIVSYRKFCLPDFFPLCANENRLIWFPVSISY